MNAIMPPKISNELEKIYIDDIEDDGIISDGCVDGRSRCEC